MSAKADTRSGSARCARSSCCRRDRRRAFPARRRRTRLPGRRSPSCLTTVVLRGQGSRQQLIVEARAGDTYTGDRTGTSTFASSNPNVATVDAAGRRRGGRRRTDASSPPATGTVSASTVVEVERASAPYPLTFRNHVMPVLTQGGLQLGSVPRRAVGQERIQADAARIRSRGRLPDLDAPGRGAPHQQGRARTKPHAAEADARRLARRRQAVRAPARRSTA